MELIVYFGRPGTPLNEGLDLLQLRFFASLKPGRVMKDELRVGGKGERAIDIVNSALPVKRI